MEIDDDENVHELELSFTTGMSVFTTRILWKIFDNGMWPEKAGYILNIDKHCLLVYDETIQRYIERMIIPRVGPFFLSCFKD